MIEIELTAEAADTIRLPVHGSGAFQDLRRKLQRQLNGTILTIDARDIELIRFAIRYGPRALQVAGKSFPFNSLGVFLQGLAALFPQRIQPRDHRNSRFF